MKKGRFATRLWYKFIIPASLLVVVVMTVASILCYSLLRRDYYQEYLNSSRSMLNVLRLRTDEYLQALDSQAYMLNVDLMFYPEYYTGEEEYRAYNYRIRKLQNLFLESPETDSVLLYIPEKQELYVVNKRLNLSFQNAAKIEKMDWYKGAIERNGDVFVEPVHYLQGYEERYRMTENEPVFSISRVLSTVGKVYGVLSVNYTTDRVVELLQESVIFEGSSVFLCNGEGRLYAATDTEKVLSLEQLEQYVLHTEPAEGAFELKGEGGIPLQGLYCKLKSGDFLVQVIPQSQIYQRAQEILHIMLMILLLMLLSVIACIWVVSASVTRPLEQLKRSLAAFGEGKTQTRIVVNSTDEVGEAAQTFNAMAERIDWLINEEYRLKLENHESRLKQLLAQINPHFLYNTLESISCVAGERGVPEVEEQLLLLSDLFRYTVRNADTYVTLREEVDYSIKYLEIQKFRFEERLNYTLQLEQGLEQQKVPKFLLQPLVENAIKHGLENLKRPLCLWINGKREGNWCVLTVGNNGGGMPMDRLVKYQEAFAVKEVIPRNESTHIGLLNIYNRLVLRYAKNFSMKVENRGEEAFVVTICLPMGEEEQGCSG